MAKVSRGKERVEGGPVVVMVVVGGEAVDEAKLFCEVAMYILKWGPDADGPAMSWPMRPGIKRLAMQG